MNEKQIDELAAWFNVEELESLIGKRVRIRFFDGTTREGLLGKPNFWRGYSLDMKEGRLTFTKTHVRKVEVIS